MNKTNIYVNSIIIGLTILYGLSFIIPNNTSFFTIRNIFIDYTGILALSLMSISIILALKLPIFERLIGGLDKSYHLHKWLGITALLMSVFHWVWTQSGKWGVKLGLLVKPAKKPPTLQLDPILQFLQSQRHFAEEIGEKAFYGMIVILLIALIKNFPYKTFFNFHKLLPIVYLILVFHSIILLKPDLWLTPIGIPVILLILSGTIASIFSLLNIIKKKNNIKGMIQSITYFNNSNMLKLDINTKNWNGHKPGQFAFLSTDSKEGFHPFTICSSWNNDGKISFMIKGLGDYTKTLPQTLTNGQEVVIDGPYGCFDFKYNNKQQIWIAGGVGITPFISKLEELVLTSTQNIPIHLFYCANHEEPELDTYLIELSLKSNIKLHLLTNKDKKINFEYIKNTVSYWQESEIWFCGPKNFGNSIYKEMLNNGMNKRQFHQEMFEFR